MRTHTQIHTRTHTPPFKDISLLKLNLSFFPLPSTTHCRCQQNKQQHFCALIVTPANKEGGAGEATCCTHAKRTHTHTESMAKSRHHSPTMDKGMSPCKAESANRDLWQRVFTGCVPYECKTKKCRPQRDRWRKQKHRLASSKQSSHHHHHHHHFLVSQRICQWWWSCHGLSQQVTHVIDSYRQCPSPHFTDSVKPHIRPSRRVHWRYMLYHPLVCGCVWLILHYNRGCGWNLLVKHIMNVKWKTFCS